MNKKFVPMRIDITDIRALCEQHLSLPGIAPSLIARIVINNTLKGADALMMELSKQVVPSFTNMAVNWEQYVQTALKVSEQFFYNLSLIAGSCPPGLAHMFVISDGEMDGILYIELNAHTLQYIPRHFHATAVDEFALNFVTRQYT